MAYYLEHYTASFKLDDGRNALAKVFKEERKKDFCMPYNFRASVHKQHVHKKDLKLTEIASAMESLKSRYKGICEHVFTNDSEIELVGVLDTSFPIKPSFDYPTTGRTCTMFTVIIQIEGCFISFSGRPNQFKDEWKANMIKIVFPDDNAMNITFHLTDHLTFRRFIRDKMKRDYHLFKDEVLKVVKEKRVNLMRSKVNAKD